MKSLALVVAAATSFIITYLLVTFIGWMFNGFEGDYHSMLSHPGVILCGVVFGFVSSIATFAEMHEKLFKD